MLDHDVSPVLALRQIEKAKRLLVSRIIALKKAFACIEKMSLNFTRAHVTLGTNRSKASIVSSRVVHHFAVCILITVGHVIRRLGIADAADSV